MTWLQQNFKVAVATVGIAAIALYFILTGESGPEAAINDRLDEVCDLISYDQVMPQLQQVGTAKKLSECVAPNAYLVAWPGQAAVTSPKAVTGMFMYLLKYASEASVSMSNRQITLDANGIGATVTATISAKATVNGNTERHSGRYRIEMEKIDGEWLIATAEPLS